MQFAFKSYIFVKWSERSPTLHPPSAEAYGGGRSYGDGAGQRRVRLRQSFRLRLRYAGQAGETSEEKLGADYPD
jgi:hypothetical protein